MDADTCPECGKASIVVGGLTDHEALEAASRRGLVLNGIKVRRNDIWRETINGATVWHVHGTTPDGGDIQVNLDWDAMRHLLGAVAVDDALPPPRN